MDRNEALRGASAEVVSGVIAAEEVYSTMSTLGCGWESLVVVNVDEVSTRDFVLNLHWLAMQPKCLKKRNKLSLENSIFVSNCSHPYTADISYTTHTSPPDHYPTARKPTCTYHICCARAGLL